MIHGVNGIIIGDYTQISQNVAILSGNHDPHNLTSQLASKPIRIGRYCLLGFNSVILPGVELGDFTIVGANAVVTKSFPGGYVVLAGSPARALKKIHPARAVFYRSEHEYHGYIPAAEFPKFQRRYLSSD
jgi:acetyltransferase-like isoleucine patch superfamily enzyme